MRLTQEETTANIMGAKLVAGSCAEFDGIGVPLIRAR